MRSRIFRTPRAFSGKSRVLPTTQSAAAARRCGRFGEPCFCYAKMVRLSTRPKQKQTIKKMVCFCLAVANHYDAHVFFVFNEIWRVKIQTMNSLFRI